MDSYKIEDIINYYNGYKQGIFEYNNGLENERIRILEETNDNNIIESLGWIPGVPINSTSIFRIGNLKENNIINTIEEVDLTYDEVLNDKNKFYDWVLNTDETIEDLFDKGPIAESYVFNKKDLYIDFNKFESGKSNLLLITGLSGSGKSTIATSLSSKYKAEVIELDIFEHNGSYSDKNLNQAGDVFVEYFLNKRKDLRNPLNKVKMMNSEEFMNEFDKFFNFVINYCNKNKDKKFIIEGVQIYSNVDLSKIKRYPIILINTSVKDSIIQRFKRNGDGKVDWKSELKNGFPQLISWYIDSESTYNSFKKSILKEEYIEEKLSYKEKLKLKDSDFGLPKQRKYPLHNEVYVRSAIKFFNYVDKKYEKELAESIIKKMKEYELYDIEISKNDKFYNYYQSAFNPEQIKEDFEYIIENLNKQGKEPIYILLTKTDSIASKVISNTLGDFYTHASISFDLNMDKIYSFDKNGFVIEELQKGYKEKFGNIPIAIYSILIEKTNSEMIKNKIENMLKEKKKYYYNYLGALGLAFEKPVQINNAMFCSEFVDQLLKLSGNDITGKNSSLVTPQDFKRSKFVYKIYEGKLNNYSINKAQKSLSKLKDNIFTEEYLEESIILNGMLNITKNENNDWVTYANQTIGRLYNFGPCDQGLHIYLKVSNTPNIIIKNDELFVPDNISHGDELTLSNNDMEYIIRKKYGSINRAIPIDHPDNKYRNYTNSDLFEYLDELCNIIEENKKEISDNKIYYKAIGKDDKVHIYANTKIGSGIKIGTKDNLLKYHAKIKPNHKANTFLKGEHIIAIKNIEKDKEIFIAKDNETLLREGYYIDIIKDTLNYRTLAVRQIDIGFNFGECNNGLHNYLSTNIDPNIKVIDNYLITIKQIVYGDELSISPEDFHHIDTMRYDSNITFKNNLTIFNKELFPIGEAREFPVQFDKDGSLIIRNIKKLNFEEEYQKSHKLLLSYDKTKNYEGMKYELSKLWYINIELERRIYNSNRDESKLNEYTRVRARILNDFNKYIKVVNNNENDFNFSEYYEEGPFNDGSMKLRKSTLEYLGHYLKQLVKGILI